MQIANEAEPNSRRLGKSVISPLSQEDSGFQMRITCHASHLKPRDAGRELGDLSQNGTRLVLAQGLR
jgi:hypothetical protein